MSDRPESLSPTSHSAQVEYILNTLPSYDDEQALAQARQGSEEFGLAVPDEVTGSLLTTMAATGSRSSSTGTVAVTPAVAVVGLYLLRGMTDRQSITCIEAESEHQALARTAFKTAGYAASRSRFLPARPLDVMGRLAFDSYHLVYLDVSAADLTATIETAVPLLCIGGSVVIADSLLDGTIADLTRHDRETAGARAADEAARAMNNVVVARLPLGAGITIITRVA